MMEFVNEVRRWERRPVSLLRTFLQLLAPFAPHLAEELWERLHARTVQPAPSLSYAPWPRYDPDLLVEETLEIPVQVNGKLREVIRVPAGATAAELQEKAVNAEKVRPFLADKRVRKAIVIPGRLVNLVLE
jgi:leucyl-tRNA synthetase